MLLSRSKKGLFLFGMAASVMALMLAMPFDVAAGDAVQARKDLKAMGLEYNSQEFAKAAGNGDLDAVKVYLEAGMDVNEGGGAAIGLAAGRGKLEMVKFLLSAGAKPTSNALQYARTRAYKDIEKILTDAGAKE